MGQGSNWQRHFLHRKESIKTTWKFRLGVLILVILIGSLTRGFWVPTIGQSLVCMEAVGPSDVIVVETFAPNYALYYALFERAAALQRGGFSARVLVLTQASRDHEVVNSVSTGIAELMARVARVQNLEIIRIREIEPISLNATYQIRDFLTKEHLRSVIVVTSGLRSRRSSLVYHAALNPAGIQVYCTPVFGQHTPENWMDSWHGIEEVTRQFLKLQFYRFYILPLSARGDAQ